MSVPDYYKILGVSVTASQKEIREAYKKCALRTHPDRVATNDPTRDARTREFQQVNDAYYTLGDRQRRRNYDDARRFQQPQFPQHENPEWQDEQFGGVFEEMLREQGVNSEASQAQEVEGDGKFYGILGGISGAALGFIVGNVPGLLAGAVAGNRLGAIRDTKGKSVYEVFHQLPQAEKAKVLADIASKILSSASAA